MHLNSYYLCAAPHRGLLHGAFVRVIFEALRVSWQDGAVIVAHHMLCQARLSPFAALLSPFQSPHRQSLG